MNPSREQTAESGYLSEMYAHSFAALGVPRRLEKSQSWILRRGIFESGKYDAMGCYPIFCCNDWEGLPDDLDEVSSELVSLTIVTDPFGAYDADLLGKCFPDRIMAFKEHYVTELNQAKAEYVSSHNSRYARKSLKSLTIEIAREPSGHLSEWLELYLMLVARHKVRGIAEFSRSSFDAQLRTPGIVMFRALLEDKMVGAMLWYIQGEIAYYHLGAYSEAGYAHRASYGIVWHAIDFFKENGLKWLSFGAGAGTSSVTDDGLTRFKSGWSNGTKQVYLCGRIFQKDAYAELSDKTNFNYFPAYRTGEFS